MEVILQCSTVDGTQEIKLGENSRVSFGRGSEADYRFDDDGLSRLHSTVFREDGKIWVVDENSTNGTFVNGAQVYPSGTSLENGDRIKIGHYTDIKVKFVQAETNGAQSTAKNPTKTVSASASNSSISLSSLLPIAIITFGLFIIGLAGLFIGYTVIKSNKQPEIVKSTPPDEDFPDDLENENKDEKTPTPTATPKTVNTPQTTVTTADNTNLTNSPEVQKTQTINVPSGKKYSEMSDSEKRDYIKIRVQKVASLIGNNSAGEIPPLAIDRVKGFLDGFASRAKAPRKTTCGFGDNLQATYERASKNAPFIIRAFNQQGIDPQIGMYLAMIESEHCVCLQSPTKPLGMFQFTFLTAKAHFPDNADLRRDANPNNGDDRCKPELAAKAAASYMRFLTGRFGTGPMSLPLSVGSYNSGEGGLSKNLETALQSNEGLPRDFWALVENSEKLSKQFQSENFKYVPKFFASAIVGENPADFGLTLQPLSTYTK